MEESPGGKKHGETGVKKNLKGKHDGYLFSFFWVSHVLVF